MNSKQQTLLACLCVVVAFLIIHHELKALKGQHGGGSMVKVVLARQGIDQGQLLTKDILKAGEVPERFAPRTLVPVEHYTSLLGRTSQRVIQAGEPLSWNDIEEDARGLSSLIPKGSRAITINVGSADTFDGLLRPGDHVDVLGLFEVSLEPGELRTICRLIEANLVVLAVGATTARTGVFSDGRLDFSTVTLAATPAQAQNLNLSARRGELSLVLRSPDDLETPDIKASALDDLLGPVDAGGVQILGQ